ncbi:MAG TPA: gamma-glutamyltransferase [Gaiellaceae bacterium]|nr:gamma-glutamyltransferase [Gaiellaceae bacterium]
MISDSRGAAGLVVAATQPAADAGAGALAAGGTAVDAAVAAGFALCVVDAANCGVGGYGGFLTYLPPDGEPVEVDFNTWVPERVDPAGFRQPGDVDQQLRSGPAVAPPATVPGLVAAHERFGRLPLADLVAPAIRLAGEGFPVGHDLGRALAEQWEKRGGGPPELAAVFFPEGRPPVEGERLVLPDLARTLEAIAREGAAPLRSGPLVEAICDAVRAAGGFLEPDDFLRDAVVVGPPETVCFESALVAGPPRQTSGAGVLFGALAAIEPDALGGENRDRGYVDEVARALLAAWDARTGAARLALQSRHTTNLCAADPDGGVVALTFTHGPWFGSGILPAGTGVLLNAGANLFASTADGPRALTNMAPVVVRQDDGTRHALGGTGGPRIPALLLTAIVDVVHYGLPLADALAAPHLSVRALERELEAEPALLEIAGRGRAMGLRDYGPAAGITRTDAGSFPAVDPRFGSGVASV